MIYDSYLSMTLIDKLIRKSITVYTPKDIDHETKRRNAYPFQGKVFWDVGFELLGSAFTFAEDRNIKGLIYLTPFACGVDAFILEFIERRIKSHYNIPLLKLTIDEHTGEAGFDTRLEAFLDMVG
jgi:predicted nucleotide-binding protein (sugar kinase/HSP70/actin superfamily)